MHIKRALNLLPRPLVRWLRDKYLAVLDARDRVRGNYDKRTPPRSLHFVGGGGFNEIGQDFFNHFVNICNLKPDEIVLDIGCGTGRMAIPLTNYIRDPGAYFGFDISRKAINWCQDNIASKNPQFTFIFADIKNIEYNSKGKVNAKDYQFPCEANSVDFAFATSVFTHMKLTETQNYLKELRRCLKPSGRALLTFFILDEHNKQLIANEKSSYPFSIKLEDCYTIDKQTPERAIAYTDNVLFNAIADAGLYIKEPILWGSWSGRESMLASQDTVIVRPRV